MSATLEKTFDVFLSYSPVDARAAGMVERALTEAGLKVFAERKDTVPGEDWKDDLWEGMANSEVVVVVVARSKPVLTSSQAVEVGAALAWQKPIHIITSDDLAEEVPSYLQKMRRVTRYLDWTT